VEWTTLVAYISEWLGAIAVAWILASLPRFQQTPLGFRFPRREAIVSLSIFALITLVAFVIYLSNPPSFLHEQLLPAPTTELTQALFLAGLTLIPVLVALLGRGQPVRSVGWEPGRIRLALQTGLAIAMLTLFLRNRVFDVLNGLNSESLTALLFALGIAVAEETTFRGYILPRLSAWIGEWPGLALSAALFTAWHMVAWVGHLPVETVLILTALTFTQGMVLGWMMQKTGHVLTPALYRAVSIWLRIF
jgi:membrane protease YdiL (CAAX protease family)